ncbi:MAG: CaiB/BaiF CoA transferase family protein [Bacteroidales bacterium]
MSLPLSGVRVVDLTRLLPGAYCTLVLADLGADVVKVEEPGVGDLVRGIPPRVDGTSVYFHVLNRNKHSVTLDLRSADARSVLDRLLETSDVVVESFRPQTARRLRVSAADLRRRHPRLVHCSLTGFGQHGPYAERPAHDLNFVALAGLFEVDQPRAFHEVRRSERPGVRTSASGGLRVPGLLVADIGGAWAAVAGITSALFHRERTGEGTSVDISIHDVAVSWLTFPAAGRMIRRVGGSRGVGGVSGVGGVGGVRGADGVGGVGGVAGAGGADGDEPPFPITSDEACYNLYTTADGRAIALAAIEQKFWRLFCERIGHPEFIERQFVPGEQEGLREEVAAVFRARTVSEWLAMFADTDVCLTPVRGIREAIGDSHLAERNTIAYDEGSAYVRSPIRFIDRPSQDVPIRRAQPLGADTDTVLRERGVDEDALQALRARGVI